MNKKQIKEQEEKGRSIDFSLWAVIIDGTITQIGNFPYFLKNDKGVKRQIRGQYDPRRSKDRTQLAKDFNLYPVFEENIKKNSEYDPDLISEFSPEDFIEDGVPVRRHVYEFKNNIRTKLLDKLKLKAEIQRRRHVPTFGGQLEEFKEVEMEAFEFNKLSKDEQDEQDEQDWPFLSSAVGIDYNDDTSTVSSLVEASERVIKRSEEWRERLIDIRNARKQAAFKIENAETDEEAYQFYLNAFANLNRYAAGKSVNVEDDN